MTAPNPTYPGWERVGANYRPVLRERGSRHIIRRARVLYQLSVFAKRHAAKRLHA